METTAAFIDQGSIFKNWRRSLYGMLHAGRRYTCPFCEKSFNRFLSGGSRAPEVRDLGAIGIGRRDNARCPECGSNDRARLQLLYLRSSECFSFRPLRLLDIAPDRHLAEALRSRPTIDYVCGSIHPQDFADLGAEKVDVTAIPYADNTFDVVLCNHVLQQVPDDRLAMREIARVLKPKGWGIIQVPVAARLDKTIEDLGNDSTRNRRKRFGSTLHVRLYGRDYTERLRTEGLDVAPTHPIRDGWCKDAERFATIADEEIYVVRKKA